MVPDPAVSFRTITPHFTVPDVVAAAKYYADVLGFEIRGFFGTPPVFGVVGRGPVEIFFSEDRSVAGGTRLRAAIAYDAYIQVEGVDAFAAQLQARGAKIVEGPRDRVYGMREVVVDDCHGLRLAFGENRGAQT